MTAFPLSLDQTSFSPSMGRNVLSAREETPWGNGGKCAAWVNEGRVTDVETRVVIERKKKPLQEINARFSSPAEKNIRDARFFSPAEKNRTDEGMATVSQVRFSPAREAYPFSSPEKRSRMDEGVVKVPKDSPSPAKGFSSLSTIPE